MKNILFKYLMLFCFCLYFSPEAFSQQPEQIAFLKIGIGSLKVEEINLYPEAIMMNESSYLIVLSVHGSKAWVRAWGKRVEPDSNGVYTAVTGFIDTNALVLFQKLTASEQR